MKRIIRHIILAAALVATLAFTARAIYRAKSDLVTLDVRRMDVRQVVKILERQTWETIILQSSVEGPVTVNVRNAPLREVLDLIAEQTAARSGIVYPLFSSSKSLQNLKTILRGNRTSNSGWTNLNANFG